MTLKDYEGLRWTHGVVIALKDGWYVEFRENGRVLTDYVDGCAATLKFFEERDNIITPKELV